MSSLEVNKIVGAALLGGMVVLVSSILARSLVVSDGGGEVAMVAPQDTAGAGDGTATAPEPAAAAELEPVSGLLAAADLAAGEAQFKKCATCHTIAKGEVHKIGPNLWGIVGAAHAHAADYDYTAALKGKAGNWDYESLNAWLFSPKAYAPGTKMTFAGLKKLQDRANLIAWLRNQSDAPLPLPEAGAAAPAAEAATTAEPAATPEAPATAEATTAEATTAEATTAEQTAAAPAGGNLADLLQAADPAAGQKVAAKCKACHSFDQGGPNKVGPNLWDIVGAKHAHKADFNYSDAIKGMADKEWTYEELDKFLTGPKDYAPGTKMAFAGIKKPEDRAALLAWLRSLSDSPKPLP